jgi:hypothetical protein
MPVTYVDPDTVHNPSSGTAAPAAWFTNLESNYRSITNRVSARIYQSTTQSVATPGPTTLTLASTDWNNGMTVGSNAITVPASYAGKYWIVGNVRINAGFGVATYCAIGVAVNGTVVIEEISSKSTATGSIATCAVAFSYALAVSDALTLSVTSTATPLSTVVSTSVSALAAFWLSA